MKKDFAMLKHEKCKKNLFCMISTLCRSKFAFEFLGKWMSVYLCWCFTVRKWLYLHFQIIIGAVVTSTIVHRGGRVMFTLRSAHSNTNSCQIQNRMLQGQAPPWSIESAVKKATTEGAEVEVGSRTSLLISVCSVSSNGSKPGDGWVRHHLV